jgi:endonuclease/exonuclease/phosphatase family metal-dependent hydrolase
MSFSAQAYDAKVLSWNVFMLPKPIWFSWQKFRTEHISDKLKDTDYDLMFFQEAFMKSFHGKLKNDLKKIYPYQYVLGRKHFYYPMPSGVAVMSKHPFRILDHIYYKNCDAEDCLASKGSMLVEVTFPNGKKAQFASTHLQAKEKDGPIRIKQLTQLKAMLDKHKVAGVPQILMGDLNIDGMEPEPEFHQGQELLGMEALDLTGPIRYTNKLINDCYKTYGNGHDHEWIDHVWVRGMSASQSTLEVRQMTFDYEGGRVCPLSDHHAVEAKLSF